MYYAAFKGQLSFLDGAVVQEADDFLLENLLSDAVKAVLLAVSLLESLFINIARLGDPLDSRLDLAAGDLNPFALGDLEDNDLTFQAAVSFRCGVLDELVPLLANLFDGDARTMRGVSFSPRAICCLLCEEGFRQLEVRAPQQIGHNLGDFLLFSLPLPAFGHLGADMFL